MNKNPDRGIRVAVLDCPDWWKMHRIVWGGGGISPCIVVRGDQEPNVLVRGGPIE